MTKDEEMQLQPPTDNLYKFLAIGGLAAIIASIFYYSSEATESYSKRLKLEHEFGLLLDEFHINFGSKIAHDDLDKSSAVEKFLHKDDKKLATPLEKTLAYGVAEGDPESVKEHINLHYDQLGKLMSNPFRDAETQSFWERWYDVPTTEFEKWREGNPSRIQAIRSRAIEFRPRYEKSLQIVREIWMIEDAFAYHEKWCGWGAFIGVIMVALGFSLWYARVQCLQDRILQLDLEEKERKLGNPTR